MSNEVTINIYRIIILKRSDSKVENNTHAKNTSGVITERMTRHFSTLSSMHK